MGLRQKKLLDLPDMFEPDLLNQAEWELERHPEAARQTDDEMNFFVAVLDILDFTDAESFGAMAVAAGIITNARASELEPFELARRMLARWSAPAVRELFELALRYAYAREIARLRTSPDWAATMLEERISPAVAWCLKEAGHRDQFAVAMAARERAEAWQKQYQWLLIEGRILFDKYVIHSDASGERQRARKRRQFLTRRLQDRQVHFRTLQIDLHQLKHKRKEARRQAMHAQRQTDLHLTDADLAAGAIRSAEEQAEAAHRQAMAEIARTKEAELAALRGALAEALREHAAVLAERAAWGVTSPLQGRTVVVVGDDPHAEGYRALVEAAGGRMVHVSAVEKFGRITGAVGDVDLVILMTAHAKHKADYLVQKAWKNPRGVLLRCPTAGLAAFQRLLRQEALPRMLTAGRRQTAAAKGGNQP